MRPGREWRLASTIGGAATLLAAALPLGCSGILGIHDIGATDGTGPSDGTSPSDGTTFDASPDARVDATSDAPAEATSDARGDVNVDGPPPGCGVADAGGGAVGVAGCPCSPLGNVGCAGIGQTGTLFCGANGIWTAGGACGSGQVCDPYPGPRQGTCVPVDALCVGMSPGALVCSDEVTIARCSDDLLSHAAVMTCTGQACIAGLCAGVCAPGTVQSCATTSKVTLCGTNGQWTTQFCTQFNPDCGPYGQGGQALGCTCYGHHVGINCVDPVELAPGIAAGWHVEVDPTSVYWSDMGTVSCDGGMCTSNHDAHIQSTGLAGGGPTTLLAGFLPVYTLFRVNAAGVYWEAPACPADGGACTETLSTVAFDAGAPAVVAATPGDTDFALDANAAYVTEQSVGLVRVPLDGSAQTTLATSPSPLRVAIDATTGYFTDSSGSIWSVALGGGSPKQLTTAPSPTSIAVDSSNVYFEEGTCPDAGTCVQVLAMPLAGGTATPLATLPAITNIVPWGGNVYFTDGTYVMSAPVGGGTVTTIAAPKGGLHDIAVDATSIYWADLAGYGVWKIGHP